MYKSTILLLTTLFSLTRAQNQPDGAIVPFSTLPSCAYYCGPLSDVQGACTPPQVSTVSTACFCGDPRLQPLLQSGTNGVQSMCGAAAVACHDQASLEAIQNWYEGYCGAKSVATGTSGGSSASATGTKQPSTNTNNSWLATHWKYVVMLIVIVVAITGIWVGSCIWRRRYIRNREKEYEMRPPVAWGPHQMQGATGGYNYGDGVSDASKGGRSKAGVYAQETKITPANANRGKRESKGWLRKSRI